MEANSNNKTNSKPTAQNGEESEQCVSWLDVKIQHKHPNSDYDDDGKEVLDGLNNKNCNGFDGYWVLEIVVETSHWHLYE